MIVLNVTYKCRPGMAGKFLEAIRYSGVDAASRAEDGNLRYDYYFPADGGDELFLLEKWRDAAAVALHGRQAHFLRLAEIKSRYVTDTIIERFEV